MVQNTAVATMLCCSLAKFCQNRLVAPNCWFSLHLYRPEAMPYNTQRVTVTPLAQFC